MGEQLNDYHLIVIIPVFSILFLSLNLEEMCSGIIIISVSQEKQKRCDLFGIQGLNKKWTGKCIK